MTIDEINIPQATSSEFQLTSKATGTTYPLVDEVLIGRELDCTIRLQDPQIRRYHAKVSASEDGLFLEDLNSKNNTYLNGCRIGTGAWVTLSDEINFDGVKFTVEAVSLSQEEPPVEDINLEDTFGFGTPLPTASPKPEMPFSNQDVVEATRALEERAKARLQSFKESEESGLNPDWEEFIANRNKKTTSETTATKPLIFTPKHSDGTPASLNENGELRRAVVTPISSRQAAPAAPISDKDELAELEKEIAALTDESLSEEEQIDVAQASQEHALTPEEPLEPAQEVTQENDFASAENELEAEEPAAFKPATKRNTTEVNLGSGPRLLAQTAPIRGKCYLLAATDAKKTWTIGRASNTDMQLSEEAIDLIHAHIELTDAGYKIRTTRTTNGMLINGKFNAEATLKHGDNIQFGRIEFIYRDDEITEQPSKNKDPRKVNYGMIAGALVVLGALLAALLNTPMPV